MIFSFRMESILRLKKQQQMRTQEALATGMLAHERAVAYSDSLLNKQSTVVEQIKQSVKEGIVAGRLAQYDHFLRAHRKRILEAQKAVNQCAEDVDILKEAVMRAMQAVKMLEIMREKAYASFLEEQLKQQQKDMDELLSFRKATANAHELEALEAKIDL